MCDFIIQNQTDKYENDESIIKTSDIYINAAEDLPIRFEYPNIMKGYGTQNVKQNPFYKTSNSEYGWYKPNSHTVSFKYYPKGQRFSNDLAKFGMYKNFSLNMN